MSNSNLNYLVKGENALFYESGYGCDNGVFLSLRGEKFFITDGRYFHEAKQFVKSDICVLQSSALLQEASGLINKFAPNAICIDSCEFSVAEFESFAKNLVVKTEFEPNLSQKKRVVKTSEEIALLKEAARRGKAAFARLSEELSEELSEVEINFLAKEILQNRGELKLSFEPITAINHNAAKAHALPTKEALKEGDLLLVDAGVKFGGYCSDLTRTAEFKKGFSFSKEQCFANAKQNEIYNIVKEAQEAAIKAVKPGVSAKSIDAAAREVISKAGFGEYFLHSTGHGVGLDIHEFPFINSKNETILQEGMVFSVEPGIYLAGEFGVRVEDVVVVGAQGCEIL